MKIRLHVVVDKEDDAVVEVVQNALNEICSKMSSTAEFSWLYGVLCDK